MRKQFVPYCECDYQGVLVLECARAGHPRFLQDAPPEPEMPDPRQQPMPLPDSIRVDEFAKYIGKPLDEVMKQLQRNGFRVSEETVLHHDSAVDIAEQFGFEVL